MKPLVLAALLLTASVTGAEPQFSDQPSFRMPTRAFTSSVKAAMFTGLSTRPGAGGRASLACTPGVKMKTKFGGLKAFFSGEGAFFLECSGSGELWFSSYGAVIEKAIAGAAS